MTRQDQTDQLKRAFNEFSVMQVAVQLLTVTLTDASRLAGCTKSQIISLIHCNITPLNPYGDSGQA